MTKSCKYHINPSAMLRNRKGMSIFLWTRLSGEGVILSEVVFCVWTEEFLVHFPWDDFVLQWQRTFYTKTERARDATWSSWEACSMCFRWPLRIEFPICRQTLSNYLIHGQMLHPRWQAFDIMEHYLPQSVKGNLSSRLHEIGVLHNLLRFSTICGSA